MSEVNVGTLAERLGVSSRTIKNWEKLGVVYPGRRTPVKGWRTYSEEEVELFKAIHQSGYSDRRNLPRPTYDFNSDYRWNFECGPRFRGIVPERKAAERGHRFLGFTVNFPFGVAAGLLLNSRWVETYSSLGFDLLTYKTVRTHERPPLSPPNCLYLDIPSQLPTEKPPDIRISVLESPPSDIRSISITNSFGVPSSAPGTWQQDVRKAKECLREGQILIVSVVGTFGDDASLQADFARCACLAEEAGADVIEVNFSCPNSPSEEGEIFQDPELSSSICRLVKREIGDTPLFVKIGYLDRESLAAFAKHNAPFIQGVVAINTIKATIVDSTTRRPALVDRDKSGVCGSAIRNAAWEVAQNLVRLRDEEKYDFVVVGVGGAMTPQDIADYRGLGVDAVQSCTGAMFDPYIALKAYYFLSGRW